MSFWEGVRRFHMVDKGWSNIAYSFGVCLSLDNTEVLTRDGWLPLGDVGPADEVASWAPDSGIITFDPPVGFTPAHEAEVSKVLHWEMTRDHRMFVKDYRRQSNPWKERSAGEVRRGHVIPAQGNYGGPGLPISDDLLRFLVWVQADGSYITRPNGLVTVRFHFAKERKVQRLLELLGRLGLNHSTRPCHNGQHMKINVYAADWLRANVHRWMPDKRFTWEFLELSRHQADVMLDEIPLADGDTRGRYYTAVQQNADVVAALCVLNGRKAATVRKPTAYEVQVAHRTELADWVWSPSAKVEESVRRTMVGCIETVNGTIVIRQNGRIAIVGNCPHGARFTGGGWSGRQFANGSDTVGADDGNDSEWYTVLWFVGGGPGTGSPEEHPTPAMIEAAGELITEGRATGRCGSRVTPHNLFKPKPCPGPTITGLSAAWDGRPITTQEDDPMSLFTDMNHFRREVRALVREQVEDVHKTSGTATRQAIFDLARAADIHGGFLAIRDDFKTGEEVYWVTFAGKVQFDQGSPLHKRIQADLVNRSQSPDARRMPVAELEQIPTILAAPPAPSA